MYQIFPKGGRQEGIHPTYTTQQNSLQKERIRH